MSVIVLLSVDCLSDCLFFQGGFLNLLIYLQCHRPESTKLSGFDIYRFKVSVESVNYKRGRGGTDLP